MSDIFQYTNMANLLNIVHFLSIFYDDT